MCLGGTLAGQVQLAKVGETSNNKLTNSTWEGMARERGGGRERSRQESKSDNRLQCQEERPACYSRKTAQATNKLTNSTCEGMAAVECANSVSNDHHSRLQC